MKRDFIRKKRMTKDTIAPLKITIEKRNSNKVNSILQAGINIIVYLFIFFVFFKDNLKYMGIFIAFMAASVITQIIIRLSRSMRKTDTFPYIKIISDKKMYKKYLNTIEKDIDDYISKYNNWLHNNLFLTEELDSFIHNLSPQLFSRLPMHKDFMNINLGKTTVKYPITITYPTIPYNEKDQIVEDFKDKIDKKINGKKGSLHPLSYSLRENRSLSFVNKDIPEDEFIKIINATTLDLASLQSSEELIMCFVNGNNNSLDWTRFLPHSWFGNRRLLFLGTEPENEFVKLVEEALSDGRKHMFALIDADFAKNYNFYNLFNADALPEKLSVIFYSNEGNAPSRVAETIICTKKDNKIVGEYQNYSISLNQIDSMKCMDLSKRLFNINLIDNQTLFQNTIPSRLTYFELFKIRNALDMPKYSDEENIHIQNHFPVKVGLSGNGKEVYIDLTNDGDGNHCLVTGTNGSGKSEFMLTYILTACAFYRPDYLSFVAIDFKGGAMSSKIRHLPHCLGEFTNKSSGISKRELTRIAELLESEIHYREEIMEVNGCANDLSRYHKLYAEGKVTEALPRLLIVVDEVAVFFEKDNMAVNYITHIATVGRAVGMILLLATQSKHGVIPSQVRTNINVNVEFYSEDDSSSNKERVKGRANINSHIKKDLKCQAALSSVYESNNAVIDFMTISGKSRIVSGKDHLTQFDQVHKEIERRYDMELLPEVLTNPLESVLEDKISIKELEDLYYNLDDREEGYPIGISDDIYNRKRVAFVYNPSKYNMIIYGKSQSGKTSLIKTILLSLFNRKYGLKPLQINTYILAKNSNEYKNYTFPHIGSILPEGEAYYFLLFLQQEIKKRALNPEHNYTQVLAIIDDCYYKISEDEKLLDMFLYITSESVKYNISIILSLTHIKNYFGNSSLKNFDKKISLFMGETFDYASIMNLNSIKYIPNIEGRCFANYVGDFNRTLETQIAYPFEYSEEEVKILSENYMKLWSGKKLPEAIELMPNEVSLKPNENRYKIPIGMAEDLSIASWDLNLANSYLISYFSDNDAIAVVNYMIDMFITLDYSVIVVDNQRQSLAKRKEDSSIRYFNFSDQDGLKEYLTDYKKQNQKGSVLIIFDYAKLLFPSSITEDLEFTKLIDELIRDGKIYGVFTEVKEFINASRMSATRFGQYLEGVNSGLLLNNKPDAHTFGFSALPYIKQGMPFDVSFGLNVSPNLSETKIIKIGRKVSFE